jgi:hypothetical protein
VGIAGGFNCFGARPVRCQVCPAGRAVWAPARASGGGVDSRAGLGIGDHLADSSQSSRLIPN